MITPMLQRWNGFLRSPVGSMLPDAGLLVLRLGLGGLMAGNHGLGKLQNYSTLTEKFADPIGIGVAASATLAVFAEFFCSILLAAGIATRLAATQLMATMGVAAFIVHGHELFSKGEMALVYLVGFTALLLTGPGRFSVDHVLLSRATGNAGPVGGSNA